MAQSEFSKIEPQLISLAEEFAFEFVDAEIVKEGASRYFRIYIDKPGGITLNDCESYHRRVIPLAEPIDYDFLEVCSPGLDRPLKKEKDFLSHIGDTVEIHLYKPRNGSKVFEGVLNGFECGVIRLGTGNGEETFEQKEVSLCKPVVIVTEEELNGKVVDLIPDGTDDE